MTKSQKEIAAVQKRWRLNNREKVRATAAAWRLNNPDKVRAYKTAEYKKHTATIRARNHRSYLAKRDEISAKNKEYYRENRETYLRKQRAYVAANKEKVREWQRRNRSANRARYAFYSTKKAARVKGLEFDLTLEWFEEKYSSGACEMSGVEFNMAQKRGPESPSIDRINPSGPYTQANCRAIIWALNRALSNHGEEYMIDLFKRIIERRG